MAAAGGAPTPAPNAWLRGLGDRVVQRPIPKDEKEDPWAAARLDALFAKFTAPAPASASAPRAPEFVEHALVLNGRAPQTSARVSAPDCRAAAVYRLRGTKTLVVVTAVQMGGSAYELRVHVRAPRNRTIQKEPDALVHARMTPEDSRRLLAQLVYVPAMHEQEHVDLQGDDDLSINRHHPHVLSILTRMAELDKLLVQEAREHNPLLVPTERTIDSRLVLVAFAPLPAGAEEVLCLVGHSAAFTHGDVFSVATRESGGVDQLCDVLGRDYVKECGLVPTPACAKLIGERAALFSPTTGRNGVFDRLANFDVLIEAGDPERDVRRLVAQMRGVHYADADADGASPPSPTPSFVSSVDDDEPRIAPPVIPSNQGKRPGNAGASAKGKAGAKKRARAQARDDDEDESEDDEEFDESDEEDVSDGDGEDAGAEDEDEDEDEDESEEEPPAPRPLWPKRAKPSAPSAPSAPTTAAPAAPAPASSAPPLVFGCPDGVREVHTDCIYLKNVQMLAHIPVAVNAPEGATEAKVVVQYYARGA